MKPNLKLLKALPAVMFIGCAEMPEGAVALSPEEVRVIEGSIENTDRAIPFAESILRVADPLFDLEGNPTTDNTALMEGLSLVLGKVESVFDAGHLVRISEENADQLTEGQAAAFASGIDSSTAVDDYIVIVSDEKLQEGWEDYLPNTLMHEGAHYYFGGHPDAITSLGGYVRMEDVIRNRDVSWIMGEMMHTVHLLELFSPESVVRSAQNQVEFNSELDVLRDKVVETQKRLVLDGWVSFIEENPWLNEDLDNPFLKDNLEALGVTSEEFHEILLQQTEFFEEQKPYVHEAIEVYFNAQPELREEFMSEGGLEVRTSNRR